MEKKQPASYQSHQLGQTSQVGCLEEVQIDGGVNRPEIGLNLTLADDKLSVIRAFPLGNFVINGKVCLFFGV